MPWKVKFEGVVKCYYVRFPKFQRAVIVRARFCNDVFQIFIASHSNEIKWPQESAYNYCNQTTYNIEILVTISLNTVSYNAVLHAM